MKKTLLKMMLVTGLFGMSGAQSMAQTKATVRFDTQSTHQRITGFGGFVCSPQFTYNHMSSTEIEKVWGKTSTVGCNIMRLYIPVGKNAWGQSLETAKKAKKMGLIVFASPWGQPAEWKTNGTINAKNSDGTLGYLKKENWADYAQYLEDYVQYMRKNGVELDAISIQNEPDWQATYAGCMWSASDIASFVKQYGKNISCKVMAPETLAVSDSYANALNKSDILECFDIYGGHQYGGIQSAYKNLAAKGKEIWMTEYLINWNENQATNRNYDFSKDFFNFFTAINTCMLGDFNAWIHYAAKRYYAMMGDGQNGTTNGAITKRGYIMAHFAKFVTGMTRIDATLGGNLEGSAYLSQTGDTIVTVMANASDNAIDLTFDLPFYTQQGELRTTGKSQSFKKTALEPENETCRPVVSVAAKSVATVMFVKSRERQASDMKGEIAYFERKLLDDMTTTKTTFGTTYKLSNKTGKKFDNDNPLISSRKTISSGYIALDEDYEQLVMHIKKVTTTGSMTAGKPTLYYVNAQGKAASHEYDRLDLSMGENFDVVFDLSSATLPDGCIGLLSLTCDNTQSHLTINFGDVYLTTGNTTYAGVLSGAYVADDSYVLDFSSDPSCTSVDMTAVTGLPTTLSWMEGRNCVVYATGDSELSGTNVVKEGVCASLVIDEANGAFHPAQTFTVTQASYTCEVNGQHIVQLPFQAEVPEGVNVYTLTDDLTPVAVTTVPANQPLLVEGQGKVTFLGSGEVSYAACPISDDILPITTTAITHPTVNGQLSPVNSLRDYDLQGMPANAAHRGVIIRGGKKYLMK